VEDYVQPLFYLEVFGKREVAGVRSGVAQTVACNIAEGELSTVVATGVLAINRTSFFVTGVPTVSPLLMAFRLINWFVVKL